MRPVFDNTNGVTPCDFFIFRPKFDKMLDSTPFIFSSFRCKLILSFKMFFFVVFVSNHHEDVKRSPITKLIMI